jgi:hypothetical protein
MLIEDFRRLIDCVFGLIRVSHVGSTATNAGSSHQIHVDSHHQVICPPSDAFRYQNAQSLLEAAFCFAFLETITRMDGKLFVECRSSEQTHEKKASNRVFRVSLRLMMASNTSANEKMLHLDTNGFLIVL